MFFILLFLTVFMRSFGEEDWSYCGPNGPAFWPALFPEDCSLNSQSPIDIDLSIADLNPTIGSIEFKGYDQTLDNSIIINTGRTIEILLNSDKADVPTISGGCLQNTFNLVNIHYHWGYKDYNGSEHAINGRKYAMECHFVHINEKYTNMEDALKNSDGVAVLAVLFKTEPWWWPCWLFGCNSAMKSIAAALKNIRYAGTEETLDTASSVASLLPSEGMRDFCCYDGSLTTPNCTEAVTWIVYLEPLYIASYEMDEFRRVLATKEGEKKECLFPNIRPLQQLNDRNIVCNFLTG